MPRARRATRGAVGRTAGAAGRTRRATGDAAGGASGDAPRGAAGSRPPHAATSGANRDILGGASDDAVAPSGAAARPAPTGEPNDATPFLPPRRTLTALRVACAGCRGCPLWRDATQAVFGAGAARAALMLVGEMPGDDEDRAGTPFVGPSGKLLDRALADAGIDRAAAYVTNAVKHFHFALQRGMRLHKTPKASHVDACRPWLVAEVAAVKPALIVALGGTATRAVMGRPATIASLRGRIVDAPLGRVLVTVHPSLILRTPDRDARHAAYAAFVADLRRAGEVVAGVAV